MYIPGIQDFIYCACDWLLIISAMESLDNTTVRKKRTVIGNFRCHPDKIQSIAILWLSYNIIHAIAKFNNISMRLGRKLNS